MLIIIIALIIILFFRNYSRKNKILTYTIWILLTLTIVHLLAPIIIGIGYYIDPTGWGENNVIANFFITIGYFLLNLTSWL